MRKRATVAARDALLGRAVVTALLFLALSATTLVGQVATQLTLEDAIRLAKGNNPTFLSTQNDQSAANWRVREAYSAFVPTVRTTLGGTWQQAGSQQSGRAHV